MISFFGNYYGGLVVKNLEKVFYMICGVALVFVGIIIGGLLENDADAQTEPSPEYICYETDRNHKTLQEAINRECPDGYILHQVLDREFSVILIFKKK